MIVTFQHLRPWAELLSRSLGLEFDSAKLVELHHQWKLARAWGDTPQMVASNALIDIQLRAAALALANNIIKREEPHPKCALSFLQCAQYGFATAETRTKLLQSLLAAAEKGEEWKR